MQRVVPFAEEEFYHLYNRGVDKRTIFASVSDYKRFMMLLYLANSEDAIRIDNVLKGCAYDAVFTRARGKPLVAMGAFCLMPNHFHILATPLAKNGISRYMLKLQTGYAMYFNTKYERTGSLFQGPFKSKHADDDAYLKYLFSYIHLNPASIKDSRWKEKMVGRNRSHLKKYVETYAFSSLREFISGTHVITDPIPFPSYLSSKKDIVHHISDWLDNGEQ